MKKKDKNSLKTRDINDLQTTLKEVRESVISLRINSHLGKEKNTRATFEKRKEIAQILTVLREKELHEKNT